MTSGGDELRPMRGWQTAVLEVSGGSRSLLLPEQPPSPGAPLCVLLHGRGSTARTIVVQARTNQLISSGIGVVVPQGIHNTWNMTGEPRRSSDVRSARCSDADDLGFLSAVIDRFGGPGPNVVAGFSQGAAMAYRFGLCPSYRVDLVVAVAGTCPTLPDPCGEAAVLHIHGTEDNQIPLAGSASLPSPLRRLTSLVRRRALKWSGVSRMPGGVMVRAGDSGDARSVELRLAENLGHCWPGGRRVGGLGDDPRSEFDATGLIVSRLQGSTGRAIRRVGTTGVLA